MLTYSDALEVLLAAVPDPTPETVPIQSALGRCLAEDVLADTDLPPFDKSLVDGFALRARDLARGWYRLTIVGEAAAGEPSRYPVGPAEATRIMTGAVLPTGADAVQMVEQTEELSPREVVIKSNIAAGEHILKAGAEAKKGTKVLEQGMHLGPAGIGVLAAVGRTAVKVYRTPTAVAAATGNELVVSGQALGPGQIRDSNTPMLACLGESVGIKVIQAATLDDTADSVRAFLDNHRDADVLLISGGLSMGEKDFVHRVIKEGEGKLLFHKVAVKPGKPVLAARRGKQLILGLPGNPVSSFVTFQIFVHPALRRFQGFQAARPQPVRAVLVEAVIQKPGRLFFKPGKLVHESEHLSVKPLETRGSADLVGAARADALIQVPADCEKLEKGSIVDMLLLDQGGLWR